MFRLGESRIEDSKNWRASEFRDKQALYVELGTRECAAIDGIMNSLKARNLPFRSFSRDLFSHPDLDSTLATVFETITEGRGFVVLRGIPVDRYDISDIERIYWGIGSHFGYGHSQSARGDLVGHVFDETKPGERQSARGYLSRRNLALHTDLSEIVGLMCVRRAKRGGESVFVSAPAVYNIVLAEHPEFMPVYLKGFPYHRRGEEAPGAEPITPYNIPIFSTAQEIFSCFYVRGIFEVGLRELHRELTPLEADALAFLDEVMNRDDICLHIQLEPGDAAFTNNRTVLHARTEFEDWDAPEQKRLLLRLWLKSRQDRPAVENIEIYRNASGQLGIDHQPGQEPATAAYRA
jgi:hypothetical protein